MSSQPRRAFLRRVTGGLVGSWLLTQLPEYARGEYLIADGLPPSADDEVFWSQVRDQFPLSRERAYLNNGTIGPSPLAVRDAIKAAIDATETSGENYGGDDVRAKLAKFVGAKESEISMTHNVTEGINIVAWGLPLKQGDEVIITTHEHAGNALPWLNRAKHDGIVLRTVIPADTAAENLNRINDLITPRTRAIAVPHITCIAGHVFPVNEIAALARDKHIWSCFDGAHGPGMMPLDLHAMGADTYASCCHKWMCGPKGTGFVYVSEPMLEVMKTTWIGAYSDTGWDVTVNPPELKAYVPTAHRFDYGTQNVSLLIGLGATVDFLRHIGMENIANRDFSLASLLRSELAALGQAVDILTPEEDASRAAIVGFRLKSMPFDAFGQSAGARGFRIRQVPENHVNCVRISTHLYNNPDEVRRFVDFVKECVK